MFYALLWSIVVALLALWSLAAWALHAAAAWALSNAGALSGAASGVDTSAWPAWLAPWMTPEISQWVNPLLASLGPLVDTALQAAPALAGGVTGITWVVWGAGGALLVVLGAGMHLVIALLRRRESRKSMPKADSWVAAG